MAEPFTTADTYSAVVSRWWSHLPGRGQDAVLASVATAGWLLAYHAASLISWHPVRPITYYLAGAGLFVALLLRRRAPLLGLLSLTVLYPAAYAYLTSSLGLMSEFHLIPVLIASYAAASAGCLRLRELLLLTSFAVTVMIVPLTAVMRVVDGQSDPAALLGAFNRSLSWVVFVEGLAITVALLGVADQRQRRTADALWERNLQLQRLRKVESEQLVVEERTRIARELHDVVAHHFSAVVVRAQAADRVAANRPEEAREAVHWIATTGQEALRSMRQVVRVLRSTVPAGSAELDPGPTLAALPQTAARMASVGLAVDLRMPDPLPALTPEVELAAVRIVQEALTNVLTHARATRAVVQLRSTGRALYVDVDDDGQAGPPPSRPLDGTPVISEEGRVGHGLLGMHERTASCGGRILLTASPLGGWAVRVWLPLPGGPVGTGVLPTVEAAGDEEDTWRDVDDRPAAVRAAASSGVRPGRGQPVGVHAHGGQRDGARRDGAQPPAVPSVPLVVPAPSPGLSPDMQPASPGHWAGRIGPATVGGPGDGWDGAAGRAGGGGADRRFAAVTEPVTMPVTAPVPIAGRRPSADEDLTQPVRSGAIAAEPTDVPPVVVPQLAVLPVPHAQSPDRTELDRTEVGRTEVDRIELDRTDLDLTQLVQTRPLGGKPGPTEPSPSEPSPSEPSPSEPSLFEPAQRRPSPREPSLFEPRPSDAGSSDAGPSDAGQSEHGQSGPGPTESGQSEPGHTESGPTEPGQSEPSPGSPSPAEGEPQPVPPAVAAVRPVRPTDPAGAEDETVIRPKRAPTT